MIWTIAVGAVANAACALLGCYLVLRRMSLLGDAISHAVLPGIALAFLASGSVSVPWMLLGAMVVGVFTALVTQLLHTLGRVPEDTSLGVVFTSLFAVGVILITRAAADVDLDPQCVLYGLLDFVSIHTIPILGWEVPRAMLPLGGALLITTAFVSVFWKELKIVSFDPALATAMGISAVLFHYLLMTMVAGITVVSFEAVGSILVVAMLIVPPATAHLLTDRLGWMMVLAVLAGVSAAVLGCVAARYFETSAAGMMAVMAGLQFSLAVIFAPRHGLITKMWHQAALATRIVGEDIIALLYRHEELAAQALPAPEENLTLAACVRAVHGGWVAWWTVPYLRRRGELEFGPGWTLRLTGRGRDLARSLIRSHRLWEAFLGENFQLPLDHLHASAERVEHFIGPHLQAEIAAELHRPAVDPHGREIPGEPAENPAKSSG